MRLILAASLLMLPVPGFAAPPPEAKAKPQSNKKICRVDPEDTDSRIRRRICKTEAEWIAGKYDKGKAEAAAAGSADSGK
jgi:hypothetical protein